MEAFTDGLAKHTKYAEIFLSLGSVLLIIIGLIIVFSKYFIGVRTSLPDNLCRVKLKLHVGDDRRFLFAA